jgi:heme/copper-type cytochrome/quinol oxidase subunit 2
MQQPAPAPAPIPAPSPGKPIIVQTIHQPPVAREITMGDVVLGSVGFVGLVMIVAAIVGLLVGLVVVLRKRAQDRTAGPTDPGHARLRS